MSRPNDFYQFIPGWQPLDWYKLLAEIPDGDNYNWLVILSSRQLSILRSLVNMVLPWYWLWQIPKSDNAGQKAVLDFKYRLERDLMAVLSVEDLIKTNLMLVAALTGEVINRDTPANYLSGEYDPTGVQPQLATINTTVGTIKTAVDTTNSRLSTINTTLGTTNTNIANIKTSVDTGNTNQHTDITNLIAKLEEIKDVLGAADPDSLADELSDIATNLTAVATILGV